MISPVANQDFGKLARPATKAPAKADLDFPTPQKLGGKNVEAKDVEATADAPKSVSSSKEDGDDFDKSLKKAGNTKKARFNPIPQKEITPNSEDLKDKVPSFFADGRPQPILNEPALEIATDGVSNEAEDPALEFMVKMQQELGVEPEEIVTAMVSLSPEELMKSPAESKNSFLEKLDLEGADRVKAGLLYENMLTAMNRQTQPDQAAAPLGTDKLRRQDLNQRIEKMSESFFLNDRMVPYKGVPKKIPGAYLQGQQGQGLDGLQAMPQENDSAEPATTVVGVAGSSLNEASSDPSAIIPAPKPEGLNNSLSNVPAAVTSQASDEDTPVQSPKEKKSDVAQTLSALLGGAAVAASSVSDDMSGQAGSSSQDQSGKFNPQNLANTQTPQQSLNSKVEKFTPTKNETLTSEATDSLESVDQGVMVGSDGFQGGLHKTEGPATAATAAPVTAAPAQGGDSNSPIENLNQVYSETQRLIRRGGGEMKMKLNPEGLGELQLKVAVNGGKVNIQMLTESNDTKKLLENGFNDLKIGLDTHKLSVEGFKVEVADKAQANQNNFNNSQQQRQTARDFMNSFREQNESFRQGFYETPGLKEYRGASNKSREIDPAAISQANRNRSRRLDVVA